MIVIRSCSRLVGVLLRVCLCLSLSCAGLLASVLVGDIIGRHGTSVSAQDLTLRLVGQSPTVAIDGTFAIELAWTGPIDPAYSVAFTVYGQVASSEELRERGGQVLNHWPGPSSATPGGVPLDAIARSAEGHLLVQLPLRGSSPADPNRVLVPDAGVYPVVVQIRGPDGPVASVVTQLIRLPEASAAVRQQPVSLLLGIGATGLATELAIGLLEDHPTVPLTVVLDETTLGALEQSPELTDRLRTALGGRLVIGPLDLDLDPSALAEIGQGRLYEPVLSEGRSRVASLGFVPAEHAALFDGALTEDGGALLVQSGVTTVIDGTREADEGGLLSTPNGKLAVVPLDGDHTAELREDEFTAVRAHRLLAELSLRGVLAVDEQPSPVLLGGPDSGGLSLIALDVLLDGFDPSGFLEAVGLNEELGVGGSVRPDERSTQDLRPLADQVATVLDELATYQGFYISGGAAPEELRGQAVAALSRELDPASRSAALTQIRAELDTAFAVVSLPDFQAVTLAAQQSVIPLAIHNDASGGRNVMLRFESDKVEVPADGTVLSLGPGASSLDIDVIARSVGLSPMDVVILTPDGRRELARTRFQVRSTAVPGLGLLLSGAALGMLAVWWARSILKGRRSKHEAVAS